MNQSINKIIGLGLLGLGIYLIHKKRRITKRSVAAGLLRQGKNTARFWAAYINAHRNGHVTLSMTEHAERLLNKQQVGLKIFNNI